MQIKLFTVSVGDNGSALQEMNTFLRGNKILNINENFVGSPDGAYWCFSVRYMERADPGMEKDRKKTDYRTVLDEVTFTKFSKLREKRKKIAAEEGVSAFIIFTDEELAELARLDEITEKSMLGIKGIGEKKVERFARHFITKENNDEASGQSE